jgi:hypothetical protein
MPHVHTSVADFNPNHPVPGSTGAASVYGVYDGRRWRMTDRRATAVQWFHNAYDATIWEKKDVTSWLPRGRKDPALLHQDGHPCDMCRVPQDRINGPWLSFQFLKRGGKIVDPLTSILVCSNCRRINDRQR